MNINEWRKNDKRVKDAAAILTNPAMRQMLEVLADSSPLATNPTHFNTVRCPNSQQEELGYIKGWHDCVETFKLMGSLVRPTPQPVQQNYNPEG